MRAMSFPLICLRSFRRFKVSVSALYPIIMSSLDSIITCQFLVFQSKTNRVLAQTTARRAWNPSAKQRACWCVIIPTHYSLLPLLLLQPDEFLMLPGHEVHSSVLQQSSKDKEKTHGHPDVNGLHVGHLEKDQILESIYNKSMRLMDDGRGQFTSAPSLGLPARGKTHICLNRVVYYNESDGSDGKTGRSLHLRKTLTLSDLLEADFFDPKLF